ncbi:glycosyltransferase family 31 protein [Rutstroemia sp. NJR-2017a WRK4]|nr:glycosyltransferase family 31 protein [Rutstroemia sp. NJR-2017a WRK4]
MLFSIFRGIPLNLVFLLCFILLLLFHRRASNILPAIDDTHELTSYLKNKFPAKNNYTSANVQKVQKLPGLLCPPPPKPTICPTPKPIQLEFPIAAMQDAPIITGPKSIEQKTAIDLRNQGIVVIFKTGAQEVSQLAIHVGTTLRYFEEADILFFSDLQGTIGPYVINDALRHVEQKIRETHADFKIYRDIHRYQSTGQDITELKEDTKKGDGREGWRLDKYKFIHMVEQTFIARPSSRWYVFIETDSYVVWPNLIQWLRKLDSTKPLYLGAGVLMGPTYFAHGGSGYILSNAAMNRLMGPEQPRGLAASWDAKMDDECRSLLAGCGDVALAKALKEQGVKLTQAHPLINGYKPSTFTYGPNDHWCQPVVTMHHLYPHEISSVWRFERQRELILNDLNATTFSELFFHFVEPHITASRDNWDNISDGPTYQEPPELREAAMEKEKEERLAAEKKAEEEKKAEAKKVEDKKAAEQKTPEEKKSSGAKSGKETTESKKETPTKQIDKKPPTNPKKEETAAHVSSDDSSKDEAKAEDTKDRAPHLKPLHMKIDPNRNPADDNDDKSPADEKFKDDKPKSAPSRVQAKPKVNKHTKRDNAKRENMSDIEKEAYKSFENCGEACKENPDCFQWVWYDKTCRLQTSFRLGAFKAPSDDGKVVYKSGWMVDKINEWTAENTCKEPQWD